MIYKFTSNVLNLVLISDGSSKDRFVKHRKKMLQEKAAGKRCILSHLYDSTCGNVRNVGSCFLVTSVLEE